MKNIAKKLLFYALKHKFSDHVICLNNSSSENGMRS